MGLGSSRFASQLRRRGRRNLLAHSRSRDPLPVPPPSRGGHACLVAVPSRAGGGKKVKTMGDGRPGWRPSSRCCWWGRRVITRARRVAGGVAHAQPVALEALIAPCAQRVAFRNTLHRKCRASLLRPVPGCRGGRRIIDRDHGKAGRRRNDGTGALTDGASGRRPQEGGRSTRALRRQHRAGERTGVLRSLRNKPDGNPRRTRRPMAAPALRPQHRDGRRVTQPRPARHTTTKEDGPPGTSSGHHPQTKNQERWGFPHL